MPLSANPFAESQYMPYDGEPVALLATPGFKFAMYMLFIFGSMVSIACGDVLPIQFICEFMYQFPIIFTE